MIRLATDIAWPPFEWITDEGQYQGIAADYMHLIEKKLGIQFEVEKNKSWTEVVEAVKQRELDVFSCVAKNPQRQEYVNFTRPYLSFPMVMITSTEISYIDGIEGLKDRQVSVVEGYATHEYIASYYPTIELHLVDNSKEGLEAVSHGRAEVFIDNIATATKIIQQQGLTNLKISGEMPIRYELGMAVRNDWPELVNILQRALDSISDEQRKEIHNKWIGVRYEHGFDYELFWKSLIIFTMIVVFLYFYNRKLSREIAERKVAENAAMQACEAAAKANQAKSEFLSVMSHELRTPLTSIRGALGLLSGGKLANSPEKAQKMLRVAKENSDRLTHLINDILDIEKLLAGKMDFHKKNIVINHLIDQAVSSTQGYADHYGTHFNVESSVSDATTISADEDRLMQVISNFISNAIKYSPKGGAVRIVTQRNDSKVRISVIDQGKGVPAEFNDRIFTHFSQADSSDTREKGGTGLGLAICKEIIERHGGDIGYTNLSEGGASFYFELDTSHARDGDEG